MAEYVHIHVKSTPQNGLQNEVATNDLSLLHATLSHNCQFDTSFTFMKVKKEDEKQICYIENQATRFMCVCVCVCVCVCARARACTSVCACVCNLL